jgi:hypothetical protein
LFPEENSVNFIEIINFYVAWLASYHWCWLLMLQKHVFRNLLLTLEWSEHVLHLNLFLTFDWSPNKCNFVAIKRSLSVDISLLASLRGESSTFRRSLFRDIIDIFDFLKYKLAFSHTCSRSGTLVKFDTVVFLFVCVILSSDSLLQAFDDNIYPWTISSFKENHDSFL